MPKTLSEQQTRAEPLTPAAYARYGQVIGYPAGAAASDANHGTAKRYDFMAPIINHRSPQAFAPLDPRLPATLQPPESQYATYRHATLAGDAEALQAPPAVANLSLFRCSPTAHLPFVLHFLERHKYSTQTFIPMVSARPNARHGYLVTVALNDVHTDRPDLTTLKSFIASNAQGINYWPGVWHSPMVALEQEQDFVCLVYERRELQQHADEDTEEVTLVQPITIDVPGWHGAR